MLVARRRRRNQGNTAATTFATGCAKGGQAARDAPRPGGEAEIRAALVNGTVEFASAIAKILQKKFSAIYLRIKRRH